MGDVDKGGSSAHGRTGSMQEISELAFQFCCEPNTAPEKFKKICSNSLKPQKFLGLLLMAVSVLK